MISVLIPIFNYDVTSLIGQLDHMGNNLEVPYEIICLDDNSKDSYQKKNRAILDFAYTQYEVLPYNVGRSKIRNMLADIAQYPHLLFLDCDCSIAAPDFLQRYVQMASEDIVLVGGREYTQDRPKDDRMVLHWKIGRQRERHLRSGFQSNNFLIPANIFHRIKFDELLSGYGHEDTLFGYQLEQHAVEIKHIRNPVIHLDLQTAEEFISKQKNAIRNLILLKTRFPEIETRLTKTYDWLLSKNLTKLFDRLFRFLEQSIYWMLIGPYSSAPLLDFYKIGYYVQAKNEKETIV